MTLLPPIEACVPHRGAMRLVQRVLAFDADSVAVEAVVPLDGLFLDAVGMPAWIGIEYMAQTVAAWAGVQAHRRGDAAQLGFLLGTRRYACNVTHFPRGAVLRIEARRELLGDNGLGMFACRIVDGERELATAMLAVFEPADAGAYLQGTEA